jgi:hypothetical protein
MTPSPRLPGATANVREPLNSIPRYVVVADHPRVVAGRDLVRVAGADVDRGSVFRSRRVR